MANLSNTIDERTRLRADPIRNFKFQVEFFLGDTGGDPQLQSQLATMGFMSVEGMAMNTDMVPYREGGWNTNPHKLPGQTDFPPLTLSGGVFEQKDYMWTLAKRMFSFQWGSGTLGLGADFRYNMGVRVLDHPVTAGAASGTGGSASGAVLAFVFYNCWTASVGFNNLDSMGNSILIHQMTVHHEGFDVLWGNTDAVNLVNSRRNAAVL